MECLIRRHKIPYNEASVQALLPLCSEIDMGVGSGTWGLPIVSLRCRWPGRVLEECATGTAHAPAWRQHPVRMGCLPPIFRAHVGSETFNMDLCHQEEEYWDPESERWKQEWSSTTPSDSLPHATALGSAASEVLCSRGTKVTMNSALPLALVHFGFLVSRTHQVKKSHHLVTSN